MRIAHIGRLRRQSSNGVDRTILGLAQSQISNGHHVEIWHFSKNYTKVDIQLDESGIQIVQLPRSRTRLLRSDVKRLISSRYAEVDLIHAHSVFISINPTHATDYNYSLL